ncbi:hypothetical protein [Hahella sp. CCB-MM4]|uniref:hypothetical protein n=1 Tax=Hahella sp. (strain CCB-MM4) TaxID=1926491 RepID=UPI00143D31A6|nr:hypothetical protein [Hahella sp. CCB-MM4]
MEQVTFSEAEHQNKKRQTDYRMKPQSSTSVICWSVTVWAGCYIFSHLRQKL